MIDRVTIIGLGWEAQLLILQGKNSKDDFQQSNSRCEDSCPICSPLDHFPSWFAPTVSDPFFHHITPLLLVFFIPCK